MGKMPHDRMRRMEEALRRFAIPRKPPVKGDERAPAGLERLLPDLTPKAVAKRAKESDERKRA